MRPVSLVADVLVLGAVLLLGYVYFPYISLFLPLPHPRVDTSYSIEIPKINAYAPVIANVDPWNKSEYEKALQQGVAQAKDFSEFGEEGTVYMFAHSSLPPWQMTRSNTAFLRLNELQPGDQIIIDKFGTKFTYEVTTKTEVWPADVGALKRNDKESILILQTCIPLGTDLKRLLVYAKPAGK